MFERYHQHFSVLDLRESPGLKEENRKREKEGDMSPHTRISFLIVCCMTKGEEKEQAFFGLMKQTPSDAFAFAYVRL